MSDSQNPGFLASALHAANKFAIFSQTLCVIARITLEMNKTIQQLDSESVSALNFMLDKPVQAVWSGNFEVSIQNNFIVASTISINVSREEYLIIDNDWSDTEKEGIDYYFLSTRIENRPADIKTSDDPKFKNSLVHYPNYSSVLLGASSKLKEIVVYERFEKGDAEEVQYDSAIFFKRQDDLSFLIKNDDSITGYLKIVIEEKQISEELSELKPRLVISAS